jgi:hypothetical protein
MVKIRIFTNLKIDKGENAIYSSGISGHIAALLAQDDSPHV